MVNLIKIKKKKMMNLIQIEAKAVTKVEEIVMNFMKIGANVSVSEF